MPRLISRLVDVLDGMGGYAAYGMIENLGDPEYKPGVPICIAENMTLKREIAKDERIAWDDIDFDPDEYAISLYLKALAEDQKHG